LRDVIWKHGGDQMKGNDKKSRRLSTSGAHDDKKDIYGPPRRKGLETLGIRCITMSGPRQTGGTFGNDYGTRVRTGALPRRS
jgi:hypothetical protein